MKDKKEIIILVTMICICCMIMSIIDGVIQPDYGVKSVIKLVIFLLCPIIYTFFNREINLKILFTWKREAMMSSILLAVSLYILIIVAYFIVRNFFDFSGITESLENNIGVTGERFIWVALYISFINSLLEEFFFRGFSFLTLKKLTSRKFAYMFSSLAFACYHVAMMIGWFSIPLLALVLFGLMIGGLLFNYLNEKNETIYSSWMVHMFANFAINTVGFILFAA